MNIPINVIVQSGYRFNTNLNDYFMLLSYDPDMIGMFKIILNTISITDYNGNKKKRQSF